MIKKWLFSLAVLFVSVFPYADAATQKNNPLQSNEIYVDSDHAKLFCRTMGKGNPLIVIHGGPGFTQDYLLPQLQQLAENNLVIFYDQRGCGRSTGKINLDTINIPTFVKDLENIRKAFNLNKVALLGHSWGGLLAMHYAIEYPECVDKLILSNSMPASSQDLLTFLDESERRISPYQDELAQIQKTKAFEEGNPEIIERFFRIIFRTYCHLAEKADLLNLRMSSTASVNGMKINELITENMLQTPFDLRESLKTLQIPTLIIHGDTDPYPAVAAQNIHSSIQGSKYVLLKNCGHFPYVEKPSVYFRSIKEFLTSPGYSVKQIERRAAFDIGSGQIKMQVSDVDLKANKIVNVLLTK